jgi:hypothetical protein
MRKREREREADLVSSATLLGYDIIISLAKGRTTRSRPILASDGPKKTLKFYGRKKKRGEIEVRIRSSPSSPMSGRPTRRSTPPALAAAATTPPPRPPQPPAAAGGCGGVEAIVVVGVLSFFRPGCGCGGGGGGEARSSRNADVSRVGSTHASAAAACGAAGADDAEAEG